MSTKNDDITKVRGLYFTFLKEKIRTYIDDRENYNYVLRTMHMIPFLSLVPNDENIIEWGLEGRRAFSYAYPIYDEDMLVEFLPPQCSMLEAVIYMAEQTDRNIVREERLYYDGTDEIFWEMVLDNLGLREYTDDKATSSRRCIDQIEVILRHFNERDYEPDGKGNIFWLREPRNGIDMRRIQIWEQMWAYVNEGQGVRWK